MSTTTSKSTGSGAGEITIGFTKSNRAADYSSFSDGYREGADQDEYTFPDADQVRPQELKMAEQLIDNLAEPFDPSKYTDDYRSNLMKIINAKMKGKKVKLEEPQEEVDSGVLDLMTKLRASLEQGTPKKKGRAAKKTPAKRARSAKRKTA